MSQKRAPTAWSIALQEYNANNRDAYCIPRKGSDLYLQIAERARQIRQIQLATAPVRPVTVRGKAVKAPRKPKASGSIIPPPPRPPRAGQWGQEAFNPREAFGAQPANEWAWSGW